MPNLHELENAMPVAPLKIIALPSAEKMGRRINDYMVEFRKSIHNDKVKNDPAFHGYIESNYLVDVDVPRFGSGEAKAQIGETIRGRDLFILTDVCNHSITYNMNGYTNHMSPDDHYQDLCHCRMQRKSKTYQCDHAFPLRGQTTSPQRPGIPGLCLCTGRIKRYGNR